MLEKRPSKKQHEVLEYIDTFIKDNGFGPSYREIKNALNYKSVSTVATHIDGLIARDLLVKRDNSARSLQVVPQNPEVATPERTEDTHLEWLRGELAKREASAELSKEAKILKAALLLLDQTDEK